MAHNTAQPGKEAHSENKETSTTFCAAPHGHHCTFDNVHIAHVQALTIFVRCVDNMVQTIVPMSYHAVQSVEPRRFHAHCCNVRYMCHDMTAYIHIRHRGRVRRLRRRWHMHHHAQCSQCSCLQPQAELES